MKALFKLLLLVSLLSSHILFANTASEEASDKATIFYEKQDYKEALKWAKISFNEEASKEVAFNIGLAYKELKDYDNAIKWYEKSFEMGDTDGGGVKLGLLFKRHFKNYPKAIEWYQKAIQKGHIDARKNLGLLYHEQNDSLNSAIYMIGMIEHPYTKERVLGLLRDDWKIDEATIKKAYELQKTLVPNPYTGGTEI